MSDLRVSKDLALPRSVVTHRQAFLGMSGSGKSNGLVVLAEEMFRAGLPWIFIDPKGDTYGIRSSGDGKKPGLDVPIFGGEHGDLPLPETSGERMGELVAADKVTGIFDLSGFETDASRARFMAAFGRALFRGRKTAIHVFCGECHEYMPQPGSAGRLDGPAADCVHVWKRILSQGRQRGIGVTLESQRAANVNKTCLTQCESLFAFRTVGRRDRDAIEAWVDSVGDAKEVLAALPRLADGECFVWSPTRLRVEQRFTFRRRSTYDSGRTPEVGEAVVVPKLADLDLGALRVELVALEPVKDGGEPIKGDELVRVSNERHALRLERDDALASVGRLASRVAFLERALNTIELHARSASGPGVSQEQAARDAQNADVLEEMASTSPARVTVRQLPPPSQAPKHADQRDRVVSNGSATNGAGPSKCARGILTALYQHGDLSLTQAAIIAGYAPDSGGVRNAAGELRAAGLVVGNNAELGATDLGCELVRDVPKLPTGKKLAEYWYQKLERAERLILGEVVAAFPAKLSLKDAAKRAGYEPSSGGVRNAAGKLRTLMLVHGGNAGMTADKRLV